MDHLPQDDQFLVLLHKKIMDKTGSAKRREKKYYMDQYRKPGSFQSRCCLPVKGSWRGASAAVVNRSYAVKKRFVQMVKTSSNLSDPRFIFITQKARTIKIIITGLIRRKLASSKEVYLNYNERGC
jgi:hypothetical protein